MKQFYYTQLYLIKKRVLTANTCVQEYLKYSETALHLSLAAPYLFGIWKNKMYIISQQFSLPPCILAEDRTLFQIIHSHVYILLRAEGNTTIDAIWLMFCGPCISSRGKTDWSFILLSVSNLVVFYISFHSCWSWLKLIDTSNIEDSCNIVAI